MIVWLHPKPEYADMDIAIWVDVSLVDKSWSKHTSSYIGSGGTRKAISNRYEKVGQHLAETPHLYMLCLGLEGTEIVFTDGRHRFAWLRDHGAKAVRILIDPEDAKKMQSRFGSPLRITNYQTALSTPI